MLGRDDLMTLFKEWQLDFACYQHLPLYSVADAERWARDIPGAHCKNLLVKDTDGRLFLLVFPEHQRVELKSLARSLGCRRFSFAGETILWETLGVLPGCVSPLGLINDSRQKITLVLEESLTAAAELCFHPLINTESWVLSQGVWQLFLQRCQARVIVSGTESN